MIGTLRGQTAEFAAMQERALRLALHHATLIEGPRGHGKTHAAIELAAGLLCSSEGYEAACGRCAGCTRVASRNHPDLMIVSVPEDKRVIPVESVRELGASLGLTPVEGRARVVIIDPADQLTEQGQNALLKTLEEPSDGTFLLLTARRPEALLATVRSRVARYRMRPPPSDVESSPVPEGIDPAISAVLAGQMSPFAAAAAVLEGAEGRTEAVERARDALRRCGEMCREQLQVVREANLAPGSGAAYAAPTEPWVDASEAVFAAEEDLAVEISPQHAIAEMFARWVCALGGHAVGARVG